MKKSYSNSAFVGICLVLLLILFVRVTRGLDLTDEMQYYGEIMGLVESGRLFSNDLYIQQTVYLLLYPAFYLHHLVFGAEGLVLFGRLLLASLILATFVYSYRKLLGFGLSFGAAGATALALTFASPYHGIFAPSYNTIAQLLWVIFMLKFFEWEPQGVLPFSVIAVITALVHPTSGAMMFLLVLMRLLSERRFTQTFELAYKSAAGGVIAISAALCFASPQEYRAALEFSSSYGVGEAFFSTRSQPATMLAISTMFAGCLLFWKRIRANYLLVVGLFVATMVVLFVKGYADGASSVRVVYVLSIISVLAYIWALSNTARDDVRTRSKINWLIGALLTYATTLAVTSGNGLSQATGAFMVGVPVLLGVALGSDPKRSEKIHLRGGAIIASLIVALFLVLWISYPYRESRWTQTNESIQSVPEFRYINTTAARAEFLNEMQSAFGSSVRGKRTLIVSGYPALYFVLEASPETCMLFMHSLPIGRATEVLLSCMEQKKPEKIIDVFEVGGMIAEHSHIKNEMREYYLKRGARCEDRNIKFSKVSAFNPIQLNNRICSLALEQI